jgi:hypothetical protein
MAIEPADVENLGPGRYHRTDGHSRRVGKRPRRSKYHVRKRYRPTSGIVKGYWSEMVQGDDGRWSGSIYDSDNRFVRCFVGSGESDTLLKVYNYLLQLRRGKY